MWRLVWYLLGCSRVRLTGASPQWALNALSQRRIGFRQTVRLDEFTLEITILSRDLARARAAAERAMCELEMVDERGLKASFGGLRKRAVFLLALTLVAAAAVWLPRFVLFYQVEGNVTVPEEQILRELRELGIGFGTYGPSIKPQWVMNHLLLRIPELQWVTVTQNGCCASVVVRERQETPEVLDRRSPRNVIASRSGVLTQVTVMEGNNLCKVGDIVQGGQLLVSAYTDWQYKTQVSGALAEIYAQTWRRETGVLPDKSLRKTSNGAEETVVRLIFGQKSVNIFGNSGIYTSDCDKMTTYHTLSLPGGFDFPVTIEVTRVTGYDLMEKPVEQMWAEQQLQTHALEEAKADMIAGRIMDERFTTERVGGLWRCHSVLACEEMIARMVDAEIFIRDDANASSRKDN